MRGCHRQFWRGAVLCQSHMRCEESSFEQGSDEVQLHLYIHGKRKDQAMLEPTLDSSLLADDVNQNRLAEAERPINVWRAYFASESDQAVRSSNDGEHSWEELEIPSLKKLSEVDSEYKTPKKLKVGTLLEALADTIPIGIDKAEKIAVISDHMLNLEGLERETARDASLRTVLVEWNKVCAGVELFNSEFEKLGKGEEKSRESISATVIRIHDAIRDTDARASLLAARIGKDDTTASGEGSELVWDSIRRMCKAIEEVRQLAEIGSKALSAILEDSKQSREKMFVLSNNLIRLKTYTVDSIGMIQRKIASLGGTGLAASPEGRGLPHADTSQFDRLKVRLGNLERRNRESLQDVQAHGRDSVVVDVAALKQQMDRMDHEAGRISDQGSDEKYPKTNGMATRMLGLEASVNQLMEDTGSTLPNMGTIGEQIEDLTKRVEKTEARGSDEVFEMDQFIYGSYSDFAQMVLDDKVPTTGVFWDLFSVLVSMCPKGLTGKERADEQYSSERIKTTTFENNLLAAMSHSRPACLYAKGGVGVLVDLEEGFGACNLHSQWISGVESVKQILGKQLKDFTAGVFGNMPVVGEGGNGEPCLRK
jgi:hypothetical protein